MSETVTSASNARRLRRRSTDVERRFWFLLRDRRLEGWKFRRQVPLGPYVADFYCAKAKLVVELDGGQHATDIANDAQRTCWLEDQGYAVVRFWNNDVLANEEGVLTALLEQLESRIPLTLSLSREGRGNAVASNLSYKAPQVQQGQHGNTVLKTDPSSISSEKGRRSVPSPLAREGQGEGVLDDEPGGETAI